MASAAASRQTYHYRDIIDGGMALTWFQIRDHYAALFAQLRQRGTTQEHVAEAGGLSGQNAISKLLTNDKLGPKVETFVKAIQGLGLSVSAFFAMLERGEVSPSLEPSPLMARLEALEHAVEALRAARAAEPAASPSASMFGRSYESHSVSPPPGHVVTHISTGSHADRELFHVIQNNFASVLDSIKTEFADLKSTVDRERAPHGSRPRRSSARRAVDSRKSRRRA